MSTIKAKVTSTKNGWESTVQVPGMRPTKLEKTDGSCKFATKSAAAQAVHTLGRKLNMSVTFGTTQKVAAKKTVK